MKWSLVLATMGAMVYPLLVQERFARFESQELSGLEDVVAHMENGSKVAYVLERPTSDVTYMKPLWHIPKALHAIENGGITHDSFAIRPYTPIQYKTGQSPTRVRPRFERTASIYEYDYILLQTGTPPAYFFKRQGVSFVVNKNNWWLFKVQDPDKNSIVIRSPGRGGFQDMFNCPPGTALNGLSGERLSVVGNIRARCGSANRTPNGTTDIGVSRHSKGRSTHSPAFGRTMRGGYPWESICAKGEAIAGFRGRHDDFLRSLEVVCRSLNGEPKHDYTLQALPHDEPFNFTVMCPAGTVATGYRGRSGLFIDQIGLKCQTLRE